MASRNRYRATTTTNEKTSTAAEHMIGGHGHDSLSFDQTPAIMYRMQQEPHFSDCVDGGADGAGIRCIRYAR